MKTGNLNASVQFRIRKMPARPPEEEEEEEEEEEPEEEEPARHTHDTRKTHGRHTQDTREEEEPARHTQDTRKTHARHTQDTRKTHARNAAKIAQSRIGLRCVAKRYP